MLLRLGAAREEVHLASRSRKGCWRMSTNSVVQAALTNEWLDKPKPRGGHGPLYAAQPAKPVDRLSLPENRQR